MCQQERHPVRRRSVLATDNPELSPRAGRRVAAKGVPPGEGAPGAAPKPRLPPHPCAREELHATELSFPLQPEDPTAGFPGGKIGSWDAPVPKYLIL